MIKYIKSKYVMFFLLIPFFKPICFQYYSVLRLAENLFIIWKVLAAVVCCFLLVSYIWQTSQIPKLVILVGLFETSILISTLLIRGDITRALIDAVSIFSYTAIITLGIKYNGNAVLYVLSKVLGALVFVNMLSALIFQAGLPADLYTNPENPLYFMTIDNGSALFLTFSITIFAINNLYSYGAIRISGKILILCAVINAFLSRSATAVFTVLLICGALVFILRTDYSKHQRPGVLFAVYIVCFIYLITMQDNIVSEFILKNIFNRSANFTGRYYLWEAAINMIKIQPWLGYGRSVHDYISAWGGYFSSHNYVLETLLQGGIVAFTLFVIIIIYTIKKSLYSRSFKITTYIICSMFAVLIGALMEAEVHSVYIFGCISLCAGSWYLEKNQEKKYGKRYRLNSYHSGIQW